MKPFLVVAAMMFVVALALGLPGLPGAALDPQGALRSAVALKGYVWQPLRDLRIRLYVKLGASPNDVVMGSTTYSVAISKRDHEFIKRYASMIEPAVFVDAIAHVCEGEVDTELSSLLNSLYEMHIQSKPPDCDDAVLQEPAPWHRRRQVPEQNRNERDSLDRLA